MSTRQEIEWLSSRIRQARPTEQFQQQFAKLFTATMFATLAEAPIPVGLPTRLRFDEKSPVTTLLAHLYLDPARLRQLTPEDEDHDDSETETEGNGSQQAALLYEREMLVPQYIRRIELTTMPVDARCISTPANLENILSLFFVDQTYARRHNLPENQLIAELVNTFFGPPQCCWYGGIMVVKHCRGNPQMASHISPNEFSMIAFIVASTKPSFENLSATSVQSSFSSTPSAPALPLNRALLAVGHHRPAFPHSKIVEHDLYSVFGAIAATYFPGFVPFFNWSRGLPIEIFVLIAKKEGRRADPSIFLTTMFALLSKVFARLHAVIFAGCVPKNDTAREIDVENKPLFVDMYSIDRKNNTYSYPVPYLFDKMTNKDVFTNFQDDFSSTASHVTERSVDALLIPIRWYQSAQAALYLTFTGSRRGCKAAVSHWLLAVCVRFEDKDKPLSAVVPTKEVNVFGIMYNPGPTVASRMIVVSLTAWTNAGCTMVVRYESDAKAPSSPIPATLFLMDDFNILHGEYLARTSLKAIVDSYGSDGHLITVNRLSSITVETNESSTWGDRFTRIMDWDVVEIWRASDCQTESEYL
ncbi:hypothetical protein BJ138DRAFT_1103789 [Hygrophoropsis aurantiaca]|uniref:Uncharacterized protein n=1 Tax=Hygrophoropsis aurantiaca TaxID=72124 RepID=A0ACB8A3N6_9AGAM|nr:hypothetical protein BJ138DRAFT_1103789 [Hygrophoropsis aurantiaca]